MCLSVPLSVCPSVCLSVCLSVPLSVCPSVCLSVCPCVSVPLSVCSSVCPSVCLFICLSVCLFVRVFVRLSVCPCVCLYVCPSVCSPVCLSVCLSVCMSVRLSVCLPVSGTHTHPRTRCAAEATGPGTLEVLLITILQQKSLERETGNYISILYLYTYWLAFGLRLLPCRGSTVKLRFNGSKLEAFLISRMSLKPAGATAGFGWTDFHWLSQRLHCTILPALSSCVCALSLYVPGSVIHFPLCLLFFAKDSYSQGRGTKASSVRRSFIIFLYRRRKQRKERRAPMMVPAYTLPS